MYQSASVRPYLNDNCLKFAENIELTHTNFTRNILELVIVSSDLWNCK